MFRKQVKVKTFYHLKSSEKKKFHGIIRSIFSLNEEEISSLFPLKEPITCHRLVTTSKDLVNVYGCQNKPMFFEAKESFYPTVFALWICPDMIPRIPMHGSLIEKLENGADLMIPGVTLNPDVYKIKDLDENTVVYICTLQNISAVAIGITMVSSKKMLPGNKGKAVLVYHTINDGLCKLFDIQDCLPNLGPFISERFSETVTTREFEKNTILSVGDPVETILPSNIESLTIENTSNISHLVSSEELFSLPPPFEPLDMEVQSSVSASTPEKSSQSTFLTKSNIEMEHEMAVDDLIMYCFLKALKTRSGEIKLPLLTNIFYKNHMIASAPKGSYVDIKKSKYKKLSNFLSEVSDKGIILLQIDKGVQTITSIDYNHDLIKNFKVEKEEIHEKKSLNKYEFEEDYVVNNRVAVLFLKCNYRKNDKLSEQELRKCITSYVKSANLVDPSSDQHIKLDDLLASTLGTRESRLTWKQLFDEMSKKMSYSYSIKTPFNVTVTGSGRLPLIKLSTITKASNKKVTLVDNLTKFGININEFSKQCQHGGAASSTINMISHSKQVQFQIQGNQKAFITKLLTESYGLPRKCIEGAEDHKKKGLSKHKED